MVLNIQNINFKNYTVKKNSCSAPIRNIKNNNLKTLDISKKNTQNIKISVTALAVSGLIIGALKGKSLKNTIKTCKNLIGKTFAKFSPIKNLLYNTPEGEKVEQDLLKSFKENQTKIKQSILLKNNRADIETSKMVDKIRFTTFDNTNPENNLDLKNVFYNFAPKFVKIPKDKPVEDLTIIEKKQFLDLLTETGRTSEILNKHKIIDNPIFPKSSEEYVGTMKKLVSNINSEMKPESKEIINLFNTKLDILQKSNLNNLTEEKIKKVEDSLPEIFNGPKKLNIETLKTLRDVYSNPKFDKLSKEDQRIMTFATLLHNTEEKPTKDIAFEGYILSQKFGFTPKSSEKMAKIIKHSDFINDFMNTNNKTITVTRNRQELMTTDRVHNFLIAAKDLKDDNTLEMAQILYSTKSKNKISRFLDIKLNKAVNDLKAGEVILPQTDKKTILKYCHEEIIRGRKIPVVKASEIPNFYAYAHTHNFNAATKQMNNTQEMKLENFEAFGLPLNDKVICTTYVGEGNYKTAGLTPETKNGLLLKVNPDKVFAQRSRDIDSLSKTEEELIYEFGYTPKKVRDYGYFMTQHRSFIETNSKSVLRHLKEDKPQYIERLNNVKAEANGKTISYAQLQKSDPKLLESTEPLMKRLLNPTNDIHNESLISNPEEVSGAFLLEGCPINDTMLDYTVENHLPLVIFDKPKN